MSQVDSIIRDIQNKLQKIYNDHILCNQYAWWLLEAITNKDRAHLVEHMTIELSLDQHILLDSWLKKLIEQQFPIQYILGSVPFNGVDILVEPPVLIPRPETEEWTIHIAQQLQKLPSISLTILDLCTGSGCIAIALAKALPTAHIFASDIEDHAIALTEKNCIHNTIHNVMLLKSDLFESIPQDLKFDLIVGNPPYIATQEWQALEPSVKNWEDKHALVASDDGLKIIADIIKSAPRFLKTNSALENKNIPQLILEIGFRQAGRVRALLKQTGYCDITIEKDLEGKDRVASARVVPCGLITNR